jgi:hypothetical protein
MKYPGLLDRVINAAGTAAVLILAALVTAALMALWNLVQHP